MYLILFRKSLNEKGWYEIYKDETNEKEFCEMNQGKDILYFLNYFCTEGLENYF